MHMHAKHGWAWFHLSRTFFIRWTTSVHAGSGHNPWHSLIYTVAFCFSSSTTVEHHSKVLFHLLLKVIYTYFYIVGMNSTIMYDHPYALPPPLCVYMYIQLEIPQTLIVSQIATCMY